MTAAAEPRAVFGRLRERRPRLPVIAALTVFSTAAVGAGLGRALVTTYLPVLLADIRDSPGLIGTVMLVNTAAGFAVPLWIGVWSDRLHARGRSRTGPFILGGSIFTAGGVAAIAIGHASSYVALALAAAVAYVGLNAVTTAHRALIPETFGERGRAAATGAEEFALLAGSLVGVVAGGLLLELASWAPFALGAVAVPLLALPTVVRMRGRERPRAAPTRARRPLRYYARIAAAPGTRLVLSAQLLWVLAYIALPPFFILYAERELGLRPAAAATLLAAFGVVTGVAVLGAGAVAPARQSRMVLLGILLLGGGLLGAATTTSLRFVAPALLAAAVGFGLVTTLGFAFFSRYVPPGEEGAYTALYFAVRSVAGAVAVPAAGWTIQAAGSYRALLVAGGACALLALVPFARLEQRRSRLRRPSLRTVVLAAAGLAGLCGVLLGIAVAAVHTRLAAVESSVFDAFYGLGGTPELVDRLLVDPHIQNYVALTLVAALAAVAWRPAELAPVLAVVPLAGLVSFGLVRLLWAVWDRPRPEEVLAIVPANGHLWAPYPSFPSGHVVVTFALVTAIATRIPWLGPPLAVYGLVIAVTRVSYGAHFPFDVVAGIAIGVATALAVVALLTETRLVATRGRVRTAVPIDARRARRLRRAGAAAGLAGVGALAVLAFVAGVPQAPEGGIMPRATEQAAQLFLVGLAAVGLTASRLYPTLGGALLAAAGTVLGAFAALEYSPLLAFGTFAVLFVPGVLLVLGSGRARTTGRLAMIAALAAACALAGAFGAFRLHASAFGATHPESTTPALPTSVVRWSWAGGVTTGGFRVVAKVAHDGVARLLVDDDARLRTPLAVATASASHDANDRVVRFTVDGLQPGRRYFYAIESAGTIERARIGAVRTFPDRPASFVVAVGGCARVGSNGAVFDAIRRRDPLFFLVLGDFFYANIDSNDREQFANQYDRALSRPAQAALYRTTPVDYVWDDHDYGPNDSGSDSPSRPAALATYRTTVPHYSLPDGGAIYHSFVVGRVRFVVTDTRSARTASSMLGARQTRWLKRELLAARANGQLAVWVNSVPWIASTGSDNWSGYPAERRELANFVARHRIRNLLMLSGDAHMVAIDDGTNNRYATVGDARFPVLHAAALDRRGAVKGGPFSEGAVGGSGQFGTVAVRDDGGAEISLTLTGWDYRGRRLLEHTLTRRLG